MRGEATMKEAAPVRAEAGPHDVRRARLVLLAIQLLVLLGTLHLAAQRTWLDTSDEAAYAEQADALLAGRGLEIGFVAYHHVKLDRDVLHPENVYPPGEGALQALAFAVLGRGPFAGAVPSVLLGVLLLPWLAFYLTRRLGASSAFALGAAVAVLFDPVLRPHHLRGLADLPFTAAVLSAVLAAGRPGFRRALLSGALLGVAFWFKPTALLFCPAVALLRVAVVRERVRSHAAAVAAMAAAFLLVSAPWLARNALLFHDPLYSANKFITALANRPGYLYEDNLKVYWADPGFEIPTLPGSIRLYGFGSFFTRFLVHLYQFFFERGGVVFSFPVLAAALLLLGRRFAVALLALVGTFAVLLSAVFAVELRYLVPCVPIAVALVFAALDCLRDALKGRADSLVPRPLRRLGRLDAPAVAVGLAFLFSATGAAAFARDVLHGLPGPGRDDACVQRAGLWVRDHLPSGTRVLTHQPARMRYYSGRLAVALPLDTPERVEAVASWYGADTIVLCDWGPLAHQARLALDAYLARFGGDWVEIGPPGEPFHVWRRKGRTVSGPPR